MKNSIYKYIKLDLGDLANIINKNFYLLISLFLLMVLGIIAGLVYLNPTYTSTSLFSVETIDDLTDWEGIQDSSTSLAKELQLLSSQEIIRLTLNSMDLSTYGKNYINYLSDNNQLLALQKKLKIMHIKDTNMVSVKLNDSNYDFAGEFLENFIKIAENILKKQVETRLMNDRQLIVLKLSEIENSLKTLISDLAVFQNESSDEVAFQDDVVLLRTEFQEKENMTDKAITYFKLSNQNILDDVQQIIAESTIVNDYRIKLKILNSFSTNPINPITVIDDIQVLIERDKNATLTLFFALISGFLLIIIILFIREVFSDSIDDVHITKRIVESQSRKSNGPPSILRIEKGASRLLSKPNLVNQNSYEQFSSCLLFTENRKIYYFAGLSDGESNTATVINIASAMHNYNLRVAILGSNEKVNYEDCFQKIVIQNKIDGLFKYVPINIDSYCSESNDESKINFCVIDFTQNKLSFFIQNRKYISCVNKLFEKFDIVLIDGPSFGDLYNTLALSKISKGICVNINSHLDSRIKFLSFLHILGMNQIELVGVVYNNSRRKALFM